MTTDDLVSWLNQRVRAEITEMEWRRNLGHYARANCHDFAAAAYRNVKLKIEMEGQQ